MNTRNIILTLLAITLIPSCSKKSTETETESGFWSWFEPQQSEFVELFSYESGAKAENDPELQKKTEDTVTQIGDKLREVNPEFSPFFGASEDGLEMTVTVHGKSEHFTAVDQFIATAPNIDGWKFTALKKPLQLSPEATLRAGTTVLTVGDWLYTKTKNKDETYDFIVYIPAKVSENPEGFQKMFSRITNDFLGERLASTILGKVIVKELTGQAPDGSQPFIDIHKHLTN